jgi:hypothetical protein
MRTGLLLLLLVACAGPKPPQSPPTTTSGSTSTSTSTSTPTPTPVPAPPATGGSVLVGDIAAAKKFNPKPTIEANAAALLACYNKVRGAKPALAGKLKLLIQVNETGTVLRVESEPEGSANDPALVECIGEALKTATFPKPGGMATVVAPLLFRP